MFIRKRIVHYLHSAGKRRKIIRLIRLDLIDFFEAKKLVRIMRSERISEINYLNLNIHWGAILKLKKRVQRDKYIELCKTIFNKAKQVIREKETIAVCFVTSLETAWSGDQLYHLLEGSGRFKPFIMVTDAEAGKKSAEDQKKYYIERGLTAYTFHEMNDPDADIFIYQNPYPLINVHADIRERNLSSLCVMIPYAVMFFGNSKENYLESERFIRSQCIWKFYCYTKYQMEQGQRNNLLGSLNMVYSGYPKTDILLTGAFQGTVWNFKENAKKRIIYAPSLYWEYSTFMQSWKVIYELAKEFKEIAWIFRPHPYLGYTLVKERQIKNIEIYNHYLEDWKQLGNGYVQIGGDYYDTFMTSDAMIADGTSLITNYQYTGKPLLVLKGKDMHFSEYGKQLLSAQYTAFGDDVDEMRKFVLNVVLNEMDEKLPDRKMFFDNNLNYLKENGKLASVSIYDDIVREFL